MPERALLGAAGAAPMRSGTGGGGARARSMACLSKSWRSRRWKSLTGAAAPRSAGLSPTPIRDPLRMAEEHGAPRPPDRDHRRRPRPCLRARRPRQRLRISPLVGYLLAGVAVGPVHAGLRRRPGAGAAARRDRRHPADVRRRPAFLAEGPAVGPRASPCPARSCRSRSRPCSGIGARAGCSAGRSAPGLVFGLALSVASTVVLIRALQERRLIDSERAASPSAG